MKTVLKIVGRIAVMRLIFWVSPVAFYVVVAGTLILKFKGGH